MDRTNGDANQGKKTSKKANPGPMETDRKRKWKKMTSMKTYEVKNQEEFEAIRLNELSKKDSLLINARDSDVKIPAWPGTVKVKSCRNLNVIHAKIGGDLDAHDAKIGGNIDASSAKIGHHFNVRNVEIGGGIFVRRAKIGGDLYGIGAKIGGNFNAQHAKMGGNFYLNEAQIGGNLNAFSARIEYNLNVSNMGIDGGIFVRRAKIGGHLYLIGAKIDGILDMNDTEIGGVKIRALTDAEKSILKKIPVHRLKMTSWHEKEKWKNKTPEEELHCGTTHCLAGWAQVLSGAPLIREMNPLQAGKLLLPNASHLFFAPGPIVKKLIKSCQK